MRSQAELTDRELRVFWLMSHGYTSMQIAVALRLHKYRTFVPSEDIAKQTLVRVFRKLGAVDRAHATRLGFEKRILTRCAPDCSACANGPRRKRTDQGESR